MCVYVCVLGISRDNETYTTTAITTQAQPVLVYGTYVRSPMQVEDGHNVVGVVRCDHLRDQCAVPGSTIR